MSATRKLSAFVGRHWERILCAAAGMLLLAMLLLSTITGLGWLKKEKPRPVRDVAVRATFGADAFNYLERQAADATLGDDHAFTVKPPAGWLNDSPVEPVPVLGVPLDGLLAQIRDALPRGLDRGKEIRPPEPEPVPPEPEVVVPPPPPVPVVRIVPPTPKPPKILTYKGVIRTTSGRQMALVTIEDSETGARRSLYVAPGSPVADGDLRIDAFTAKSLRFRTRSGLTHVVPYGDKKEFR